MSNGLKKVILDEYYTKSPNDIYTDLRLRPHSVRVLGYLWSKKTGWVVYNKVASKETGVSIEMLAKVWKELVDTGWVSRTLVKTKFGNRYDYTLYKQPIMEKQDNPFMEKQASPSTEKQDYNKTIYNKTKVSNEEGDTPLAIPNTTPISKYKNKGNIPYPMKEDKKPKHYFETMEDLTGIPYIIKKAGSTYTQKKLFWVWQSLVSSAHPEKGCISPLPVEDTNDLKLLAKRIGTKNIYPKLARAIEGWDEFTQHCKVAHGAFNPPDYPTTQYVYQYALGINTFMLKDIY